MTIQLYHNELSSASRVIRILIKLLSLKVDEKSVDITTGEHLKPQFTSKNPFHMIPTLVDGDFVLWECWAILIYLVKTYAPESSLYPTDLQARALVDRWFYWDACTLNAILSEFYRLTATLGRRSSTDQYERFHDKLQDLDKSLGANNYVAGDKMTIADLSIALNVKLVHVFHINLSTYANTSQWLERLKRDLTTPVWKRFVEEPTKALKDYYKSGTLV